LEVRQRNIKRSMSFLGEDFHEISKQSNMPSLSISGLLKLPWTRYKKQPTKVKYLATKWIN